jgi:phenylalanyl-tRNA synthetase beta chain
VTYSFLTPRELEVVGAKPAAVTLRNPLGEERSVMRTSLLPGLLQAVARAARHGEPDARLFTVGTLFFGPPVPTAVASSQAAGAPSGPASAPLPEERLAIAAVLAGSRAGWLTKPEPLDVWDAKGLAEALVLRLSRRHAVVRLASPEDRPAALHPRGAAWIEVDGKRVGSLGPIHPDVADAFAMSGAVAVLEIDLTTLGSLPVPPRQFSPLPRFPASTRDLAVVVADSVPAGDVALAVREAAGDLGEDVLLFDRFVGGSVPAGHASLALHVVYRAADRTLTDAEVDTRHAQVLASVEKRFGATLRA